MERFGQMRGVIILFLIIFVFSFFVHAGPVTVSYSTFLTNKENKPRALNGQLVYFRLFSDSSGGSALWEEQHGVIAPNGFVSVSLGSKTPLPLRIIESSLSLWLEMQIIGENPFTRQKISTSFFAISANYADSAKHSQLSVRAQKADSLGNKSAGEYTLNSQLPAVYPKAETCYVAKKADSLGSYSAAEYARVSEIPDIKVNNAANADSVGNGTIVVKNGKVGIGIPNPQYNLSLSDTNAIFIDIFRKATTTNIQFGGLVFRSTDSDLAGIKYGTDGINPRGYLGFWTNDANEFYERVRISKEGYMGINTASPTARLDIEATTIRLRQKRTIASSTTAGNMGDICWDENYLYICIQDNQWKRISLSGGW